MKASFVLAVLAMASSGCSSSIPGGGTPCKTKFLAEIPLSTTYANGNMWTGWAGRWADNLLMVNRTAGFPPNTYYRVTTASMMTTLSEMVSYKLDGASFNCDRPALLDRIDEAKALGGMPCLYVGSLQPRSFNPKLHDYERSRKAFARNFSNPYGWYAPDGRQIFISYWTDRHHKPAELAEWLKQYRREFGDFLFVPDISALASASLRYGPADKVKDYIRGYLRVADGVYFGEYIGFRREECGEIVFDDVLYSNVVVKCVGEVMNEPEFKGKKLLGLVAGLGHGNPATMGNSIGQDGTRTLRRSFDLAMSLKPDFINFFEWDEWNENTLFKPSVWNSFAAKRLFRSLISTAKAEPNDPLPCDDVSVPNLIVSYRRTLVPGETAIYEILSVPETGARGTAAVQLRLTDATTGKVAKKFPPQQVDLAAMQEIRLTAAAEDWADSVALVPQVMVQSGGRKLDYTRGLPQIEIVPGGSSDHKWAMASLRDVATDATCELALAPTEASGIYSATLDATSSEPIDRIEIEVNDNLVFSQGGGFDDFRMTPSQDVFCVTAFAKQYTDRGQVKTPWPTLSVTGAKGAQWRCAGETTDGNVLQFVDQSNYTPDSYLRLPKGAAANATLTLDWPAFGVKQSVRLAEIDTANAWGFTAHEGLTFAVTRFYGFNEYGPTGANAKRLSASVLVRADRPVSVVSAYLVTKSGRTLRAKPVVVGEAGGKVQRQVYSTTLKKPVTVTLSGNRQPPLVYDFSQAKGVVVPSGAGCFYDGTLGAIPYIATHRNRNGASFFSCCPGNWPGNPSRSPVLVKAADGDALDFDGTGTFFTIPWGAIPRFAAFRLSFEFKASDIMREQQIFATGVANNFGSIGYVMLKGGKLSACVCNEAGLNQQIPVSADIKLGEWNAFELSWDGMNAVLKLNGVESPACPCEAPLRSDCASWFGGRNGCFFKGQVRNVKIDYL